MTFRAFCGRDWDNVIEKKFSEWGAQTFGSTCPRDIVIDHLLTVLSEPGSAKRSMFTFANAPPVPGSAASQLPSGPSTTTAVVNSVPPQIGQVTESTSTPGIHPAGSVASNAPVHPPFQHFLSAPSPILIAPSVLDSDPVATHHQIAVLGSHLGAPQTSQTVTPHEVVISSVTPRSASIVSPTTLDLTQAITPRQLSPPGVREPIAAPDPRQAIDTN